MAVARARAETMKDRRSVDDLSLEELERVLAEKKRAAREARLAQVKSFANPRRRDTGDRQGIALVDEQKDNSGDNRP